ncbi:MULTISPECIES: SGNH/GDSL hydrolase family protein [unclassified Solwaraspora]|uniref:SGNH/GDSL hydrolase family protein n=1 Tax=unclassified Solwaraspora TaxID=2627926 RepID=UPI00259AF271|nr:SGNH/GDSL hydrolase family protein [Solwaraspora sp. WMMA2056]WJK39206.1 SGNH/GDSL hydrolase family protein [Solwaraspora sp. WMMA2056]
MRPSDNHTYTADSTTPVRGTRSAGRAAAFSGGSVLAVTIAAALAATVGAAAPSGPSAHARPAGTDGRGATWVAAWAPSPVEGSTIPWSDCPAGDGLADQTIRNVAFVSAGGTAVRVRVTNTFGTRALKVGRASVAVQRDGATAVAGSMRELTFGGQREVTVAAGGRALSDPVPLRVAALSTLLVSVYVPEPTGPVTNHPFTAQGNHLAAGDRATAPTADGYADTPCWMLVDGIDIQAGPRVVGSVVALGDSITDTASTTGNANQRWPDHLARRLHDRPGPTLSVVNAGLGGNRLLAPRDGEPYWGVPALARLERDVYAQTGVRAVILLEGTNDIGYSTPAADIIAGYQQVIVQTRAQGLPIFGGTVPPFGGSFLDTPERQEIWHDVNHWIRTSGAFDGVIDFAAALADPTDPNRLAATYDSGDHLHPNDAGCAAMADAVDLAALLRR